MRSFFNRKIVKVILLFLPLVAGGLYIFADYKSDKAIIPGSLFSTYDDRNSKGSSEISCLSTKNDDLIVSYMLRDCIQYPYIGVIFYGPNGATYDLSGYDYIEIEMQAENSTRIPVVMNVKTDQNHIRHLEQELEYVPGQKVYRLAIEDFKTPDWWFAENHYSEKQLGIPDYSQVHTFAVQNCRHIPVNKTENVTIHSIRCGKKIQEKVAMLVLALSIFYLLAYAVTIVIQRREIIFPCKELEISNINDEDAKKIAHFIAENYQDADVSLSVLQRELGMTETRISSVFKNSFGTTFKKYLNQVRIREAKRLLEITDRQVMEIAYGVGYGNISHFNKVFKEFEDCSPNEYRKKLMKIPQLAS